MNHNIKNQIFFSLFSISFIYFLLYTSFYFVCFLDKYGLYKIVLQNETFKTLPFEISNDDLKTICKELMSYISGKIPFLETKVTINGALIDFYSVRSKVHMSDVRNIILNLKTINYISIFICILTLFKIIYIDGAISKILKSYIKSLITILCLLLFIFIFAATNFESFFIKFHQILFTNDLWLLDPNEDYIICLLPEKIFMIYGFRIVIAMVVSIVLPFFLLQILSKIQLHQEAK